MPLETLVPQALFAQSTIPETKFLHILATRIGCGVTTPPEGVVKRRVELGSDATVGKRRDQKHKIPAPRPALHTCPSSR